MLADWERPALSDGVAHFVYQSVLQQSSALPLRGNFTDMYELASARLSLTTLGIPPVSICPAQSLFSLQMKQRLWDLTTVAW
jgi:membrane protease YdiL (CAAX protease family)